VHYPPDRQIGKAEVQGLIESATERLLAQDDPALETIKMQVGLPINYIGYSEGCAIVWDG
jgi:hypothetical protein